MESRDRLTLGLSLSLSGAYAEMGRQAEAAIRAFVTDQNAAGGLPVAGRRYQLDLACHDDASDSVRCAEIYRSLCFENRADLLFGPYSSRLARVAAPIAEQAGLVMVNHGGADDQLYRLGYRLLVGVLSPASDYLVGLARLLSTLKFWRKRVGIIAASTPFAQQVALGFEQACKAGPARRHGVRVRFKHLGAPEQLSLAALFTHLVRARINAVAAAGAFEDDVVLMRAIVASNLNIPVLACVAAGVERFRTVLGEASEGIIGPSQWEAQAEIDPEIGPDSAEFARRMRDRGCDYPAAQIYAAGLLTAAALATAGSLEQSALREAFGDLRTRTFFGDFALDRVTGRQIGHRVLLVQWHRGQKVIIDPEAHTDSGSLELPSGWRLILSSVRSVRLSRRGTDEKDPD